jgi:hypothetical protein
VDCQQVAELIDAYALGAVTAEEARAVEEHVDGCVACWELLREAQDTAALVALSAPMKQPPNWLGQRIISEASRTAKRKRGQEAGLLSHLHLSWPAATGIFGTAAAAVLIFAFSLQLQVDDLEEDNSETQARLSSTTATFADILRVATADDVVEEDMDPLERTAPNPPDGEYRWSRSEGMGIILCRNLPPLEDEQVYQAWYATEGEDIAAGTVEPYDGECFHVLRPVILITSATGVGISREEDGSTTTRKGRWLIFASLED